jgi:hypothetical protein
VACRILRPFLPCSRKRFRSWRSRGNAMPVSDHKSLIRLYLSCRSELGHLFCPTMSTTFHWSPRSFCFLSDVSTFSLASFFVKRRRTSALSFHGVNVARMSFRHMFEVSTFDLSQERFQPYSAVVGRTLANSLLTPPVDRGWALENRVRKQPC